MSDYFLRNFANLSEREGKHKQCLSIASIDDKASGKNGKLPSGQMGLLFHDCVISHLRYSYRGLKNALSWNKIPICVKINQTSIEPNTKEHYPC